MCRCPSRILALMQFRTSQLSSGEGQIDRSELNHLFYVF